MATLSSRLHRVLRVTGVSPRDASALTRIHWTTIYAIIRMGRAYAPRPVTEHVLSGFADNLEALHAVRKLPLEDGLSAEDRREKLAALIDALN